jgi:hypothetical protein
VKLFTNLVAKLTKRSSELNEMLVMDVLVLNSSVSVMLKSVLNTIWKLWIVVVLLVELFKLLVSTAVTLLKTVDKTVLPPLNANALLLCVPL